MKPTAKFVEHVIDAGKYYDQHGDDAPRISKIMAPNTEWFVYTPKYKNR